MECLTTTKFLKINPTKNVGTVVIVVEGAVDEFELFKHIFVDILHYNYIEKRRTKTKFKEYNEYINPKHCESKIIIINTKNSNINSITDDKDYMDYLNEYLYKTYNLDIKNTFTYFVWDRDNKSNRKDIIKKYINTFSSSLNNDSNINGLLLLSYPAFEGYQISCKEKTTVNIQSNNLKNYINGKGYDVSSINKNDLLRAAINMHKSLINMGINEYNIDDFSKYNMLIYNIEEDKYSKSGYYCLLSLISLIFLDLGIIYINDKI